MVIASYFEDADIKFGSVAAVVRNIYRRVLVIRIGINECRRRLG